MSASYPSVSPRLASLWLVFILAAGVTASVAAAPAASDSSAAVPVLSLRDCVDIALDGSIQLRIAEQQDDIARQDIKSAWGAFLPSVSLSSSYRKSNRTDYGSVTPVYSSQQLPMVDTGGDTLYFPTAVETGTITEDVKTKSTYKDVGANFGLTLFDGLSNVNTLKAAKASASAAAHQQVYTRSQVIQNVAVAYYNLLRYLALRDVGAEDRDRAAKELERTETYFRLGSAAKADVLQQRVRLENTKLALVTAENQVQQAFADLAYAMYRPLESPFDIDRSPLTANMQVAPIDSLYTEALANREDLKADAMTMEARQKQAAAAGGALLPQVDAFAGYTRYNNQSPYRFGSQTSGSWSYGVQGSWSIFNHFQNWTRRSQSKANARIAEYNFQQAQFDAQLEVRRFHNSMVEARERLAVSRETIAQAEEELRLAQERFRVGAGTQLDKITAEVSLAQAKSDEVQAICDYLIARAQLYRALGRLDDIQKVER